MLPRRNHPREIGDVMLEDLQREIHQLHQRLTRLEQKKVERQQGMQQKRRSHHPTALNAKEDNSPTVPDPDPLWSSEPIWDSEPKWDGEPNWDDIPIQLPHQSQNDLGQDLHRSPMEEEGIYGKDLKPDDIVPDEDAQSKYEDENLEQGTKEKPIGPPLEINIPLQSLPGRSDQMNIIRVSNIMGIEPMPFDPMTYVEDVFETNESKMKKCIRLEDNNAVGRYWSKKSSSNDKCSSSCNYKGKFFPDKCRIGCGELVWISLSKESFPHGSISKLKPRIDGTFRIIKKLSDKAYQIDFSGDSNISATFNVTDLSFHYEGEAPPTPGE